MSLDAEVEVIKARLSAAAKAPAYDVDEIEDLPKLPVNYVEVHLSRRFGGERRADGSLDAIPRRLSTRVVSQTVTNARLLEERVRASLEFNTITVGGRTSTPIDYETSDSIEPDEGWFSALTDWTYVL